jgi:hypothetical protein
MSGVSGSEDDPAPSCTAQSSSTEREQAAEQEEASTSGGSESETTKTPCAFYMRTGTCAYVSRRKAVWSTREAYWQLYRAVVVSVVVVSPETSCFAKRDLIHFKWPVVGCCCLLAWIYNRYLCWRGGCWWHGQLRLGAEVGDHRVSGDTHSIGQHHTYTFTCMSALMAPLVAMCLACCSRCITSPDQQQHRP